MYQVSERHERARSSVQQQHEHNTKLSRSQVQNKRLLYHILGIDGAARQQTSSFEAVLASGCLGAEEVGKQASKPGLGLRHFEPNIMSIATL